MGENRQYISYPGQVILWKGDGGSHIQFQWQIPEAGYQQECDHEEHTLIKTLNIFLLKKKDNREVVSLRSRWVSFTDFLIQCNEKW